MKNFNNLIIVIEIILIIIIAAIYLTERQQITFRAVYDLEESEKGSLNNSIINSIDYELGLEKDIEFSIFNPEHRNMQVVLTINGELNDSVTLFINDEDGIIDFLPSENEKKFRYRIRLDRELEAGSHEVEIVALEIPRVSENIYSGSKSRVVSKLIVYVPYPGKYIDSDLNILDADKNKTAKFFVSVVNRGREKINEVSATINIYTLLDREIKVIKTNSASINPGDKIELTSDWYVDVPPGDYLAKVSIFYDGERKNFEKQFPVGAKNLTIEGILVNNFQLGEIAKLQILVDNKWNLELEDVYASLIVYNKENQIIADIKSNDENINALTKKELIAYWDTIGVEPEEYNGKLTVHYGDKSTEKNLILKVSEDSLDIFGVGYAIRPRGGKGIEMTTVLMFLVIILLIVNLAWFVFFRRHMKRKS